MRRRVNVRFLTAALIAAFLPLSPARAEDTRGKWQFGLGMSYFSTADYIRSNSDLAFASGVVGPDGLPGVGNVDPRPDINVRNQPSIADDFKIDFNGSYGVTRWLAIEMAASYQQSHVGNIEYFTNNKTASYIGNPSENTAVGGLCGPNGGQPCWTYATSSPDEKVTNTFLPVGQVREIPIHLSGLVRFRPESPLDPYIGIGVGYILASLKTGPGFNQTAADISNLRVRAASEGEFTDPGRTDKSSAAPGFQPGPLQATVRNAFEWHAISGVDYYVNDHFSFYIDARYAWTSGQIDIRTDGAHQVQFGMLDDGRLVLQQNGDPTDPNKYNLWEDRGLRDPNSGNAISPGSCTSLGGSNYCDGLTQWGAGDKYLETEDKNLNGLLDNNLGEDNGVIHVYPLGPRDPGEFFDDKTFYCAPCDGNQQSILKTAARPMPDTEDLNFNGFMDRFLYYGIDICTTPQGAGNPVCQGVASQPTINYVWPGAGCLISAPNNLNAARQVAPSGAVSYLNAEGCPAPPASASSTLSKTDSDDVSDVVLVQGGRIRLGGFGLGFGFKFTF